jgi:hypothetical protein
MAVQGAIIGLSVDFVCSLERALKKVLCLALQISRLLILWIILFRLVIFAPPFIAFWELIRRLWFMTRWEDPLQYRMAADRSNQFLVKP